MSNSPEDSAPPTRAPQIASPEAAPPQTPSQTPSQTPGQAPAPGSAAEAPVPPRRIRPALRAVAPQAPEAAGDRDALPGSDSPSDSGSDAGPARPSRAAAQPSITPAASARPQASRRRNPTAAQPAPVLARRSPRPDAGPKPDAPEAQPAPNSPPELSPAPQAAARPAAVARPRPALRAVETAATTPPAPTAEDSADAAARAAERRARRASLERPASAAAEKPAERAHAREASPAAPTGDTATPRRPRTTAERAQIAAARRRAARRNNAAGAATEPAPVMPRHAPRPARAPAGAPTGAPAATAALAAAPVAEVGAAILRKRHWLALGSFLVLVLLPFALITGYLYTRAADQYHSEVAFSIRSEEVGSATAGLLGALTQIGTGSATDADILFEYIRSQKIVEEIDAELNLRQLYNKAEGDPVFALGPEASIETLVSYWHRMVEVSNDSNAGIIHVRANAFTAEDATRIAQAILARSSALVNRLSDQAREDAIRYARQELDDAEAQLAAVRGRLSDFRRTNRIVDPSADVAGQMGLLNALQNQLAQALVERDVLLSYADQGDQRVVQVNRRITAITQRIEEERTSLGISGAEGSLPDVIGEFEELRVDQEFANTTYTQALAGLAGARAEARRQSRYLAPHVQPTHAERALYPRRAMLAALSGVFLFLGWGIAMLIYYNVRDNR